MIVPSFFVPQKHLNFLNVKTFVNNKHIKNLNIDNVIFLIQILTKHLVTKITFDLR